MGWTGMLRFFCDGLYEYDLMPSTGNIYDMKLEQTQHGYVPVVVPIIYHWGKWLFANTGWSDAATIVPGTCICTLETEQYLKTSSTVCVLGGLYDSTGHRRNHLYGGFHIGDWLAQDTADRFSVFGATPTG